MSSRYRRTAQLDKMPTLAGLALVLCLAVVSSCRTWKANGATPPAKSTALEFPCQTPGWFPTDFRLKDHSVFGYEGSYYIASIYLPGEMQFAYARSADLCNWETLTPILAERVPGSWDENVIWAPFVYGEAGVYYLYYTGVTQEYTQSILLAISTDPSNPDAWQPQGVVFQPAHPDMVWEPGAWSDCRDASVIKVGDLYYMVYTGMDQHGSIIGLATSPTPGGPWQDWGAILSFPGMFSAVAESPTLFRYAGLYYLLYNNVQTGGEYRIGASPAGPWIGPFAFRPGWAHEIWQGQDGLEYVSFLVDYSIHISPLSWDALFQPPLPYIGESIYHSFLPFAMR
jgi:beta-xylosidase